MFCIHRKLFLSLKRVQIVKITPPQVTSNQQKTLPAKFLISPTLNAIWKTLDLLVSILDLASRGPRLLPGRREYEFSFEFMNLLLKIKGGDRRPNFIIFVVWSAFFIGIHSMQGWTATTRHAVTRKTSTKRLTHTKSLYRKTLQLIGVC